MKSGSSYFNTEICQEMKEDISGKENKNNPQQRRPPSSPRELGKKGEYNTSGWNYEGIQFYNKVCREWKTLASENKDGAWE